MLNFPIRDKFARTLRDATARMHACCESWVQRPPRWLTAALVVLSALAGGARLVELGADFPLGITRSGELYSDEGWHASGGVRRALTGDWLAGGDYNPIVGMPVLHVAHAAVFAVGGVGLTAARVTTLVFLVLLLYAFWRVLRSDGGPIAAWFGCFVLLSNFLFFAYSRRALLEIPVAALICLSMWMALEERGRTGLGVTLTGVLVGLAILTKTTAVAGLLVAFVAFVRCGERLKAGVVRAIAACAIAAGIAGGYLVGVRLLLPDDYSAFVAATTLSRVALSPHSLLKNLLGAFAAGEAIGSAFYIVSLVAIVLALGTSPAFRRVRAVPPLLAWVIATYAVLASSNYHPERYYVPLIVPFAGLVGLASRCWLEERRTMYLGIGLVVALALIAANDGRRCALSILKARTSYSDMAADVRRRIRADSKEPVIVGHVAAQVGLATGIPSINTTFGTLPLDARIERYRPTHYVALGVEPATLEVLTRRFLLTRLASYDVFDNYYNKSQVVLYRLTDK